MSKTEAQIAKLLGRSQPWVSKWTRKDTSTATRGNACTDERPRSDQKIPKVDVEALAAARGQGWDAWYQDGLALCDNPYPRNSPEHAAWRAGWLDARRHYE